MNPGTLVVWRNCRHLYLGRVLWHGSNQSGVEVVSSTPMRGGHKPGVHRAVLNSILQPAHQDGEQK